MRTTRYGVTRLEIVLGLCCSVVLTTICSVILADDGNGARTAARTLRDSVQLNGIHKAIIIFSQEFRDRYPRPGLIDRLPDADLGRDVPGRGPEDTTANTTANLYATMIMQNYLPPALVISPVERNPRVQVKGDYDWEAYDPGDDVYWDPAFRANLDEASHASYAHLVIHGRRAEENWRNTMDASFPVLGNRGPRAGEPDHESHTCGPHGQWGGNIVFADNHVQFVPTLEAAVRVPRQAASDGAGAKDLIFAMEDGPEGGDAILSFTLAIAPEGPVLQHD